MIAAATVLLALTSAVLFLFGLNLVHLSWRALRMPLGSGHVAAPGGEPPVCVQVPIYNERYVAERVLDAVCALDWPDLEVQVLDDSDDDTSSIVARRAGRWRRRGVRVRHVRRGTRAGFKAGALAHGLELTSAPFVAVFDADFLPAPDFLRRVMPAFADLRVGFVQARWGHLDAGYSWFTRLQALAIDFHFLVEQAVRSAGGYFTNFTGTAGVWRREAVAGAGGWSARTLTEDLDLSYRAQLVGWRAAYVEGVVVPEELPVSIDAYRRQQSRWATGSFQSAFLLLGPLLRSRHPRGVKVQAVAHLLSYGVGPLMLLQLACYPALLLAHAGHAGGWQLAGASTAMVVISIAPWFGFTVAQVRLGRPWWAGFRAVLCQLVGTGMSVTVLLALLRALRPGGEFVRTPKHQIVRAGQEWRDQAYVHAGDPRALLEMLLGAGAGALAVLAARDGQWLLAAYSAMFAAGFLTLAALSAGDLLGVLAVRLGVFHRLREAAPGLGLVAAGAVLLLAATSAGEPFEDGYAHWLMAAGLAATGHLRDPLFGMEDTWLPGYQVLAAAVLHVAGLWQLGALKVLGALLGAVTLAAVQALAPTRRQGAIAAGLLVLNPVFLYTSGTAVAEPLLTALLMVAALLAVRGRTAPAAAVALLACLTSSKAWIWVAAVTAVMAVELVRRRLPRPVPRLGWAVPALAVLVFLQLGFTSAGNSIGRGSLEVASATARGSLPPGPGGRLAELAATYALSALPLAVLGGAGLWRLATRRSASDAALLRFLHVPALVYLAAVFALVGAGAYSGSHRYLYPALPALALLAAAGLERAGSAAAGLALVASCLGAIAFLPVFAGFAADNAGLVAAGRAAAARPGVLVTDSPVVAYYSRKPPGQVIGSARLPAGRGPALDWLRAHGVTALVLEDISYYRATAVFPDLAAGRPSAPFKPLGAEAAYQVAGGKAVYAYTLRSGPPSLELLPGVDLELPAGPGEGKTAPLARGPILTVAGREAAGEGMGFGVPIAQYPDGWVYPGKAVRTETAAGWTVTYTLSEAGGDAAHGYRFVAVPARGSVAVDYAVQGSGLAITVRPVRLEPGYSAFGVLNEESAAFDDLAADGLPTLTGAQVGPWVEIGGAWGRLRSGALGVEWSVPRVPGADLRGGRELVPPDLDWAGLSYLFPAPFTGASYSAHFQEAR